MSARGVIRRWAARLAWSIAIVVATLVVGGALDARRRFPTSSCGIDCPARRARGRLSPRSTLADYLAIENAAFDTVHREVEERLEPALRLPANRYNPNANSHPARLGTDWNRTQVLAPSGAPVGGALLLHGLTDSPYSMRTIAQDLRARGYYVLAIRDAWTRYRAGRADRGHVGGLAGGGPRRCASRAHDDRADQPLVLVGYSNGGALAMKYALDALEGSGDPPPSRIALLSPMIGVAPFAWLARVISMLGPVPGFEKARWLDVYPEYNPFKYNSFPANAGLQTWRLTTTLQRQMARVAAAGLAPKAPPVLTFHSLVDATVEHPPSFTRCTT